MAKARTRDSMQALDKLTHVVDGKRRIISDPPLVQPIDELFSGMDRDEIMSWLRALVRRYRGRCQRPPPPSRGLPPGRRGPQGRRGGQRRYQGMDLADVRPGRERSVVPASQRGPAVGARGVRRAQPTQLEWRTGRPRPAPDGSGSDIFLGWDHRRGCRRRRPRLLRPSTPRLERLRAHRDDGPRHDGVLRPSLWHDAGPGPRPLRRPNRDRLLPRLTATPSTRRSPTSPRRTRDQNERDYDALVRAEKDGRITAQRGI